MMRTGLLKQNSGLLEVMQRVVDWSVIVIAAWIAHRHYLGVWSPPGSYIAAMGVAVILAGWLFPMFAVYEPWRGASLVEELRRVSTAWAGVLAMLFAFAFATKTGADFSRVWIVLWAGGSWLGLVVARTVLRFALRWMRRGGYNLRQVVIVGTGELGADVAARIAGAPGTGLKVSGFFSAGDAPHSSRCAPLIGDLSALAGYVDNHAIDQVWVAMPLRDEDRLRQVLHALRHTTVDIKFVPDIFGFRLINHSITEIAGLPVLNLSASPMTGLNRALKAIEDRVLALLILLLVCPLMLLLAIGVKLSSPGPVFYRQERFGWNGRPFMMLKFRSMPVDAETTSGPVWARPGESRATGFGSILRRSSLDELPQFINVLRGEMSIVGPRPERPVFVEKFKEEIPDYMKKHLVKAGITGWAQVNGWRGDTDLAKRIEYDLYYIEHWSIWFDLRIIFMTVFKGLVAKHAY